MKCPYCLQLFTPIAKWEHLGHDKDGGWAIEYCVCPNKKCNKLIIFLVCGEGSWSNIEGFDKKYNRTMIRPKGSAHPVSPDVPSDLKEDFEEACLVLPDSPKASAALSRRCLQHLLRNYAKVKPEDLSAEIQEVIDSNKLPPHICESIDAIRNIGNFAAHPIKSQRSGEILPVEPGEAEWNLDVLEDLFDFYFVAPALTKKKKEALNLKLKDAGKPPMK
jgi:hypothetical protein